MSQAYNLRGSYVLVVCPNPSIDILASVKSLKEGAVNRIVNEQQFPGGKGVHVAMALAELGEKVVLLGFWAGPSGTWLKNEISSFQNIRCVGPEIEGWSRNCYTFKSGNGVKETELLGTGPVISEKGLEQFYKTFEEFLTDAKCVCMSGSWPLNAPENGYAALIKKAAVLSKGALLDCTGVQFENAITELPGLVHLNRSESTAIFGTKDILDAVTALSKQTQYAAITDGAKGLYLANGKTSVHGSCTVKKVHSTVGSGDCLTAGLAFGFVRGFDLKNMARIGVACGAANCVRPELGLIYRQDVERLFREIVVSDIMIENLN